LVGWSYLQDLNYSLMKFAAKDDKIY
jgi:hypothetical protein